ncbi:MAG: serine hydrolase [Chloracidobacterium sp.]|nr:serine hydrolase [Chloracidobacterium sp.]
MKRYLVLFSLFVVLSLSAAGQTLDEKIREIDSYAATVAETWKGPGMAIAIVKDDRVVFAKGYGSRELGKAEPINPDTVFAIASNSKAFTTAALAILVDEKKLSWDDKVSKYLPDFKLYDPWVTSELTVRDLVTHRVGLDTFSGDLLWYEANFTPDEILSRIRYLKPVSSFRTRYGYQNLMFIAAGKVIEKASGKTWCGFITERILQPLGMNRTSCSIKDLPDNAAMPHNESGGTLRVLHRGNVDSGYSAAALNSSVNDLSKWVRTQLGKGKFEGKQIFSEAVAWQMHQPYLAQQVSEQAWRGNPTRHFSGVAMGWFVYDYHGRKVINHSGGLDGMLSYTVLIPEENTGFVVLSNSEYPAFAVMMSKIRDVMVNAPKRDWNAEAVQQANARKTAAAEQISKDDAARAANKKPTLTLSEYAGTYSDDLYGAINIAEESGRLVMRFSRSPNFVADLEHWHYDTFLIKWRPSVAYNFPRGWVTFTIGRDGKTDEMKIDQPNNDFWFYELSPKRVR